MSHHWITGMVSLMVVFLVSVASPSFGAESECLECHDDSDAMLGFLHQTNGAKCVDCHGPSTEHADRPRNPPTRSFSKTNMGADLTSTCLTCHDNAGRIHWDSGPHEDADVSCNGCHTTHKKRDSVLVKRLQADVCVDCHQSLKVAVNLPSRHPIEEGKVQCSDCHATHGSGGEASLVRATITETCVSCHKEKRGPFLFEHDPVAEDCSLCHKPHGSVLPSLLTSRPPFLCQQCHMAANHPSRLPDGTSFGLNDANLRANGCVNCHSQVHGSNHPSGARLTR